MIRIPEFRKQIRARAILEADNQAKTQAEIMSHAVRNIVATAEPRNNATTQLGLVKNLTNGKQR